MDRRRVFSLLFACVLLLVAVPSSVYAESGNWRQAYMDFLEAYDYDAYSFPNFKGKIGTGNLDYDSVEDVRNFSPLVLNLSSASVPELLIYKVDGQPGAGNWWTNLELYGFRNGEIYPIENKFDPVGNGGFVGFVKGRGGARDRIFLEYGWRNKFKTYELVLEGGSLIPKAVKSLPKNCLDIGDFVEAGGYKHQPKSKEEVYLYAGEYTGYYKALFPMDLTLARSMLKMDGALKPISLFLGDRLLDDNLMVENSRTLLPLRLLSEEMGMEVTWDPATRSVGISSDSKEIVLRIGSRQALVDGEEFSLEMAPVIKDSRTYVPLRFVSEAMDRRVDWDSKERRVLIK